MEQSNEYIQYLESRIANLQTAWENWEIEKDRIGVEQDYLLRDLYIGQMANVHSQKKEMEQALEIYKRTHKTEQI